MASLLGRGEQEKKALICALLRPSTRGGVVQLYRLVVSAQFRAFCVYDSKNS
jgi:hypothetical protein